MNPLTNSALADARLYHVEMLYLLWGLPLAALLFYYAARKRRGALNRLADASLLARLRPPMSAPRSRAKEALTLIAAAAIIVGLARPAWNPVQQEVTRRGRDVVFLLDVSRSMLAEDLVPNRLERAKLAISDAISKLNGDRVSLVAFAGAASVKCPLTLDYGFFRMALEDLSPESAPVGGTMIGDAIRKTLAEVFDHERTEYRDIVLITDGEDHASFPVEAARDAGTLGVRLIAIGLGDENVGRRIPFTNEQGRMEFVSYQGEEVWSRLDATTLRKMAAETPGGRYLNVATGAIDFGDVYRQLIATAERRELGVQTIERYEEKFQIFLALAFFLLLAEMAMRERRPDGDPPSRRRGSVIDRAGAAAILALLFTPLLSAASTRSLVKQGNQAYDEKDYSGALDAYTEASAQDPASPQASFNRGAALFRQGRFGDAIPAFTAAAENARAAGDESLEADARYNLGNAFFRRAEQSRATDPQTAAGSLESAIRAYRQAAQRPGGLPDAAHNLEIAKRTLKEILDEMRNQPKGGESQRQDQQQEDLAEKLREQIRQQEQVAQEREELERGSRQQGSPQQQKQAEDLARRQRELEQQSRETAEQMEEQAQQQPNEEQRERNREAQRNMQQAAEQQRQAAERMEDRRLSEADQPQQQALDQMRQALDRLQGSQADQQPQQPAGDNVDPQQQFGDTPISQALQTTPEDLLDEERRYRNQRRELFRGQTKKVDKDW